MDLSSRVEESCNFLAQESGVDSKKIYKQQRMIARETREETGRGGKEKPEKKELRGEFQLYPTFLNIAFTVLVIGLHNFWRLPYIIQEAGGAFKPRFKQWITQFCRNGKPGVMSFCLMLFVCLHFLVYVDSGKLPPVWPWYAIFILIFTLVVLHINLDVHGTLQAPFRGVHVEEQYVTPSARPHKQPHCLSTKVACIPLKVYSRVCVMLNVRRELRFDDFRMLAEKVGLDSYEINGIEQMENNPTKVVLQTWSSSRDATVGRLIELLKDEDLKRMDVVEVLEKWVNNEE